MNVRSTRVHMRVGILAVACIRMQVSGVTKKKKHSRTNEHILPLSRSLSLSTSVVQDTPFVKGGCSAFRHISPNVEEETAVAQEMDVSRIVVNACVNVNS